VVDCQAGKGSVELRRYPKAHAFAQLQGSDNIIAFTTQRYANQPLIVRRAPAAWPAAAPACALRRCGGVGSSYDLPEVRARLLTCLTVRRPYKPSCLGISR